MLILTRRRGKSIVIGGRTIVTIQGYGQGGALLTITSTDGTTEHNLQYGRALEIEPDITLWVFAHGRRKYGVRVGIEAPKRISIHREEIERARHDTSTSTRKERWG